MTTTRADATATLLQDGRVLIVGGNGGDGYPSATAELYDPATCAFHRTGSMPAPRANYTATLLADGRVLIAGGFDGYTSTLASALLYDPKTGAFSATGSMNVPRSNHSATLLPDGRVLIAGGEVASPGTSVALASAELYDPKTGRFSPTGSMRTARVEAATAPLQGGEVLFVSGVVSACCDDRPLASAEVYDPATGTFSPTGSMLSGWASSATALQDGRVLVLGQIRNLPIGVLPVTRPEAELYDPKTGTFTMTGTNQAPGGLPTLLPDGQVLVLGGSAALLWYDSMTGSSAQLYDPNTGSFAPTGSLTTVRANPAVALLQDGRVLVAGGSQPRGDTPGPALASAETYQRPRPTASITPTPGLSPLANSTPWWYSSDVSACGMSGMYRANGVVYRLGDCAANLIDPPAAVTLTVGQEFDVHMIEEMGASGSLVPMYPLPSSSDNSVLLRVAVTDGGASATFRAEAPGTAVLTTTGSCVNTESLQQTFGACPLLAVTVTR